MSSIRAYEQFLPKVGFQRSKLDIVTRSLRDDGQILQAGRGLYAAKINPRIASIIILAYLGTSKAVNAAARLAKLKTARSSDNEYLLDIMSQILVDPIGFQELRISRLARRARLVMPDGSLIWFTKTGAPPKHDRIDVEGVITASVMYNIVAYLTGGTPIVEPLDEPNDAE